MKIHTLNTAVQKFTASNPPRVASSARLSGIKGSEKQREQLALEMNNKLFEFVHEIFDQKVKEGKKPAIYKRDLLKCIKKIAPDVDIKVIYEKKDDCNGSLANVFDNANNTIKGFVLAIRGAVKKDENEHTLRHEMRHFFDCITQPKFTARDNTQTLLGRLENYTEIKDTKHYNFYDSVLYNYKKFQNDETENKYITGRIENHFEKNETTPDEKIEILQNWRHSLKAEVNAFSDGVKAIKDISNPQAAARKILNQFFFVPKIEIVEEMLKNEINSVRKACAKQYGN